MGGQRLEFIYFQQSLLVAETKSFVLSKISIFFQPKDGLDSANAKTLTLLLSNMSSKDFAFPSKYMIK